MRTFRTIVALLVALCSATAFAGATRIITVDSFQSGDLSKAWTPPAASDTLVGRASVDTLTNKTIDGGTNSLSNIGDSSLSVPYIKADGTRPLSGDWAVGSHKLTGLTDPASAQDAATKNYVDAHSGSAAVVGSTASPTLITAAGGVFFSSTSGRTVNFIAGNAGAVTVTATPQVAAGSAVGQELQLIGESATDTVTLADGNGLSLNGSWVGGLNSVLDLIWDGTNWVEYARQ